MNPTLHLSTFGPRILIIGNSGSGKSTLSRRLAARLACPPVALDLVYWEDQAALRKRGQAEAMAMARAMADQPTWVIEGVFGWLADAVLPAATGLVWLDLPWEICKAGLMLRGPQFGEDAAEFADLLLWAEAYDTRRTGSSRDGHSKLFSRFAGRKIALTSRAEIEAFGQ